MFQSKRAGTPAPCHHSKIVGINQMKAHLEHAAQILSFQLKMREAGSDVIDMDYPSASATK
jgi:hypothetical protein